MARADKTIAVKDAGLSSFIKTTPRTQDLNRILPHDPLTGMGQTIFFVLSIILANLET